MSRWQYSSGRPPRPSPHAGTGTISRTAAHSVSVMSVGQQCPPLGLSAALPYMWAKQSHARVSQMDSFAADRYNCASRASR